MASQSNFECIIIGCGIAGASLAFFLSERGMTDILILEREEQRRTRQAKRRRPKNLEQAFGFSELDDDEGDACLICHL